MIGGCLVDEDPGSGDPEGRETFGDGVDLCTWDGIAGIGEDGFVSTGDGFVGICDVFDNTGDDSTGTTSDDLFTTGMDPPHSVDTTGDEFNESCFKDDWYWAAEQRLSNTASLPFNTAYINTVIPRDACKRQFAPAFNNSSTNTTHQKPT